MPLSKAISVVHSGEKPEKILAETPAGVSHPESLCNQSGGLAREKSDAFILIISGPALPYAVGTGTFYYFGGNCAVAILYVHCG
jgi:hypothetical protein